MTDDQERRIVARCLRELADVLSSADLKYQLEYDGYNETFVLNPQDMLAGIVAQLRERCGELEGDNRTWQELAKLCKDSAELEEEKFK